MNIKIKRTRKRKKQDIAAEISHNAQTAAYNKESQDLNGNNTQIEESWTRTSLGFATIHNETQYFIPARDISV